MLTYRRASEAQVVAFLELLREDARDYLDQTIALMGETWEHFVQIAQQVGLVYGVYLDEALAGYYWIEERGRELHLHGIVVKTEFRGQGIGTAILEKLQEDYAGRMEVIELGVHDSNLRAKALYEHMGFVTVRRVEALGFSVMQAQMMGKGEKGHMATTLAEKLQLKPGQRVLVQNAPEGYFERLVAELPHAALQLIGVDALLLFVTSLNEVAELTPGALQRVGQAGLLWIAYPKGGSGVKTDVNRDRLAAAVVQATGWRAVRQVAIDGVWSALRFRPAALVGK